MLGILGMGSESLVEQVVSPNVCLLKYCMEYILTLFVWR